MNPLVKSFHVNHLFELNYDVTVNNNNNNNNNNNKLIYIVLIETRLQREFAAPGP